MAFQPGNNLVTQNAGLSPQNLGVPHIDVRDPTSTDSNPILYPQGKTWLNKLTGSYFINGFFTTTGGITSANWTALSTATGNVTQLTGDTGTATPSSGSIKIAGTSNEITTAASGSTVTLSTPSTFIAPGSIAATTTVTATLGNITATNGNLSLATAGNKIIIATGSNASVGTSGVMSGTPGAVTVATTASSATAKIFYSRNVTGGTPGQVSITAQDGTGFTLTSTGNETSTFNWWIINA